MRIVGFSGLRLWVIMMFYSIIPYVTADNPRTTLYQSQTISLFAFALGAGLMMVVYRPRTHIAQSKAFALGGGALTAFGTVAGYFADSAVAGGSQAVALSGILTGLGTSVLFVLWMRLLCEDDLGGAIVEYGAASAIALVISLVMLFVPSIIVWVVTVIAPLFSAACFARSFAPTQKKKPQHTRIALSKSTIGLFVKALAGAAIFGFLQGFTDIASGSTVVFTPVETHGFAIVLTGLLATCIMVCIGVFALNPLDLLYRAAMLFTGLGLALFTFVDGSYTFYTAISFSGYVLLVPFVCIACHLTSTSFGTGSTRTIAVGIAVLYVGEALGLVLGQAVINYYTAATPIALLSVSCVALFLLAHLFLLDEMSLVRMGIGETETPGSLPAELVASEIGDNFDTSGKEISGEAAPEGATASSNDTSTVFQTAANEITQTYGLSPREAEVLVLLLQGRTMSRIQETLFISAGTVSTHMRHIYQKTGVANKQELIDLAFSDMTQGEESADA